MNDLVPTKEYDNYQYAFEFFNEKLFNGELPNTMITFTKRPRTFGYMSYKKWNKQNENFSTEKLQSDEYNLFSEIALNLNYNDTRNTKEILATLVHEMVHLWQFCHGKPSRKGYHNSEWANKMDDVGLTASHTGLPGGKRTGQKMTHYINEGGIFETLCDELMEKRGMGEWRDVTLMLNDMLGSEEPKKRKKTRLKYTCETCSVNAWAKPQMNLMCGDCEVKMVCEETDNT